MEALGEKIAQKKKKKKKKFSLSHARGPLSREGRGRKHLGTDPREGPSLLLARRKRRSRSRRKGESLFIWLRPGRRRGNGHVFTSPLRGAQVFWGRAVPSIYSLVEEMKGEGRGKTERGHR